MEPQNLHHQYHLQDQQLVQYSSSLATPSCYGGGGSNHDWTSDAFFSSVNNFNPNINGGMSNSRDPNLENGIIGSSLNNSMIQGVHWPSTGRFTSQSIHDLHSNIKEEISDPYSKFNEMSPSSSLEDLNLHSTSSLKNDHRYFNDTSQKLLLGNFSSGFQIDGLKFPSGEFYSNPEYYCSSLRSVSTPNRGIFSQILPTINISNLNQSSSLMSSSSEMNLQVLDLLTSARFSGGFSQPSNEHLGLFKDSLSYGLDIMQQSSHRPLNSSSKISSFTNGVTEAKRSNSFLEPQAPQPAAKKSRLESRTSCPPLKVRKEKLGDRIAALQQLVAPFGKTDTASVLMEAIGYIKFLQNQVETLSVPYMKTSRNNSCRALQGDSKEDENEEPKRELKSRGLCLVPLSCLSYVTDGGGGVWPCTY